LCQLQQVSQQANVTLFMTLLAAWQSFAGTTTVAGADQRGHSHRQSTRAETEQMIGCFVNTLVLHTSLAGNPSSLDLLARVREVALGAYRIRICP